MSETWLKIDTLTDLTARQDRGRIVAASREALLRVLPAEGWPGLVAAGYSLLTSEGYGIRDSFGSVEPNLLLVDRNLELVRGQKTYLRARLDYRYESRQVEWSVAASGVEISDAFDENGEPIEVQYTYPVDYEIDPRFAGRTVTQGGQITATKTITTAVARVVLPTWNPDAVVQRWINRVNSTSFKGREPRTWKITDARASIFSHGTGFLNAPRWELEFEFTHDPDGWDRAAVFIDRNTNEIPPDLDPEGPGVRTVPKLLAANFNSFPGSG